MNHSTVKMSDLAPLVLSVLKDKTALDLKEENDKLAAEVARLKSARDDLLSHTIRNNDSVDITISINREIYGQGFLPTERDHRDGTWEVDLNARKDYKLGIETTANVEIRLNGMVLGKAKEPKEVDAWQEGTSEMKLISYEIRPSEHKVMQWFLESLFLYAQEETWPDNTRQIHFISVSLDQPSRNA